MPMELDLGPSARGFRDEVRGWLEANRPEELVGVDAERLKRRVFVGSALLTSAVVAFVGPIGFVGLIVPQIIRMLVGPDNRVVIPAAMLGGGAFLLLADTVARNVVAPAELSVGVITALCGAPFFVYLLRAHAGWPAP